LAGGAFVVCGLVDVFVDVGADVVGFFVGGLVDVLVGAGAGGVVFFVDGLVDVLVGAGALVVGFFVCGVVVSAAAGATVCVSAGDKAIRPRVCVAAAALVDVMPVGVAVDDGAVADTSDGAGEDVDDTGAPLAPEHWLIMPKIAVTATRIQNHPRFQTGGLVFIGGFPMRAGPTGIGGASA